MGASAKKKKEKKADFAKPKLKVGKARPKPQNQTDTSFRAKAIVLNQQIAASAPDFNAQFLHNVSLLGSRNEGQRKDSLAWLTSTVSLQGSNLPIPTGVFLDKALPLLLDASSAVRNQLVKLFQILPQAALIDHMPKILPYARAALTHLSASIRSTGLEILSQLLSTPVVAAELVSSPGGWTKTLECLATLLGWKNLTARDSWSLTKAGFRADAKTVARCLQVLEQLLSRGLKIFVSGSEVGDHNAESLPLWDCDCHCIPKQRNPYGYLNLFGVPPDDDNQMLEDRDERLKVFEEKFKQGFMIGLDGARREGGDMGRIAGSAEKVLEAALRDND